jgi:hypothetical protein
MRERLAQLGLEVAVNSPDEFVAVINADIAPFSRRMLISAAAHVSPSGKMRLLTVASLIFPGLFKWGRPGDGVSCSAAVC